MSKMDEFERLFKSASKPVFNVEPIRIDNVLIVIDQYAEQSADYVARVEEFLKVLNSVDHTVNVSHVFGDRFSDVKQLLDIVEASEAQLICTFRNLHGSSTDYPYSLGEYVDVLTQATKIPILLLPHPNDLEDQALANTDRVMLMTDHLAGDSQLVTFGAMFTQDHGELILAHVEDEQTFERYMQVISKIPAIDTDIARQDIVLQLLKEPKDFIESCQQGLQEAGLPLKVKPIVTMGHHLTDYKQLVEEHQADLLIMHTKDDDQLAMHGLAYPVSVELRKVPLLLI